jgi:hypothetical protein
LAEVFLVHPPQHLERAVAGSLHHLAIVATNNEKRVLA